ncbi:hypothetical protein HY212_03235 [Candidatus Pacearchaeota archaeon]|nr:hypothetical protein [Candidatus Pacearchaeota archaeon]
MKKLALFLFCLVLLSLVSAKSINIDFPNGNEFEAGTPITFKATLYDDQGKPMDGNILVTIEDFEKKISIEKTVLSKEVVTLDLGDKATSGQGVINAQYQDIKAISFFDIGSKELARFDLEGSTLTVTNIGNTKYSRTITIKIGETIGTKQPNLEPGEKISYRLVAPDGTYNIVVNDGKESLVRGSVPLSGTGQAIGAIDNSGAGRSPVTGGISPSQNSDDAVLSYLKNNTFVYVFILVIFGAMILIAIERQYRKKSGR